MVVFSWNGICFGRVVLHLHVMMAYMSSNVVFITEHLFATQVTLVQNSFCQILQYLAWPMASSWKVSIKCRPCGICETTSITSKVALIWNSFRDRNCCNMPFKDFDIFTDSNSRLFESSIIYIILETNFMHLL